MTKRSRPRSGSMGVYPRVRAKKIVATFSTYPAVDGEVKPLNFFGYKAGMVHAMALDDHQKAVSFGQQIVVPCTVIECPPLKVFGVRAYKKTHYGLEAAGDVLAEKVEKHFKKRVKNFLQKSKKNKEKKKEEGKKFADLEKEKEAISEIRLLVHAQPYLTTIGKKSPEAIELKLNGSVEQQLVFAKQKLGGEISLKDVFKEKQFVDVKAVNKGKGFQGVIKRFGVKQHRPKAKKRRIVGSIGPWNPSTVMYTVARAGQMGFHSRTEYNKRVIAIGNDAEGINPGAGFRNYGLVKNEFLVLAGSLPGPAKRIIALREPIRPVPLERFNVKDISFAIGARKKGAEAKPVAEEEEKIATKVEIKKEEKKGHKSVEEEIAAAAKGAEKKEKKKE
ncbi:MAG: 50S ribosomal protein L3 [Candidatus Diapherotrites archaeon]